MKNTNIDRAIKKINIVIKSLNKKYGAKDSLSEFADIPKGFPDADESCKAIKCIKAKAAITKGKK